MLKNYANTYIDIDIVGKCGSDIDAKQCFPKFEEEYFFPIQL